MSKRPSSAAHQRSLCAVQEENEITGEDTGTELMPLFEKRPDKSPRSQIKVEFSAADKGFKNVHLHLKLR